MRRFGRCVAMVAICAMVASACGGGSAESTSGAVDAAAGAPTVGAAQSAANPDERAAELTTILLTTMSDGTAIEALLLAVDAGYSADQIEAGIRNGGLDEDGRITSGAGDAVPPAGPAAGLILDDRETGSSAGLEPSSESTLQFEPVAFKQESELLPIGRLREEARDVGVTIGEAGALIVIRMITGGFDQEAIVETLLLGGYSENNTEAFEVDGQVRDVSCPYTRTRENPEPIHVSRLCWYESADRTTVYVPSADLPIRVGSSQAPQADASDTTDTEESEPARALRTWEGRFVDTRGSSTWTNVMTTLVLVEEQADGSLNMRRQTDSVFTADPAVFADSCDYVYFDTGTSTSPASRPLDSLRFEGTREGVYDGVDCSDDSGPATGTFTELVTGSLDGDVLTLNGAFDGVGPVVLDPPTTS